MPCTHSAWRWRRHSWKQPNSLWSNTSSGGKGLLKALRPCRGTVRVLPPHAAWVAKCLGDRKNTQLTTTSAEDMFQTNPVLPFFSSLKLEGTCWVTDTSVPRVHKPTSQRFSQGRPHSINSATAQAKTHSSCQHPLANLLYKRQETSLNYLMPQNEQRENSKCMNVSPCNPCNSREQTVWKMETVSQNELCSTLRRQKNIFHYFLDTNLAIPGTQANKPQHLSTTKVLSTLCSASGHKGMASPSPSPAGLSSTLRSHFSPNLLICGVIKSPTWFQIKQVTSSLFFYAGHSLGNLDQPPDMKLRTQLQALFLEITICDINLTYKQKNLQRAWLSSLLPHSSHNAASTKFSFLCGRQETSASQIWQKMPKKSNIWKI